MELTTLDLRQKDGARRSKRSHWRIQPDQTRPAQREDRAGTHDRGKEETGYEGEMVDEESELVLVPAPVGRPVKDTGKEQDIGHRNERGFPEECTGQKAQRERELEKCCDPGQRVSGRDAGRG